MSEFESIAIIPGDNDVDEVWVSVKRTINGSISRFIERFKSRNFDPDTLYDAWFVDGGGSGARTYTPATAGSTTLGAYTEYYVGYYNAAGGNVLVKAKTDGTIDTDWGTNGFWGYTDPDTGGQTLRCLGIHELSSGKLLVATNPHWLEESTYAAGGKYASLTMLNANGTIDTTWGYNGHYIIRNGPAGDDYPWLQPTKIFECDDGTFVVLATGNSGSPFNYHKISADGTSTTVVRAWDDNPRVLAEAYDACWYDTNHEKVIVVGSGGNYPVGSLSDCFALNVSDLTTDTSWGGLGFDTAAGYANVGPNTDENVAGSAYGILSLTDGFIILHKISAARGDYTTISKVNLGGTAYDTTWGTSGHIANNIWPSFYLPTYGQSMDIDDTYFYVLQNKATNGVQDTKTQVMSIFNISDGSLSDSEEFTSVATNRVYHNMQVIDGNVYFGTLDLSPATDDLEIWNSTLTYQDSFEITGANVKHTILQDESTRETTVVPGQDEAYGAYPTGYAHLEGETVNILADGIKYPQQTVTNGDIDDSAFSGATNIVVGLPVRYKLVPMELNFGDLGFCLNKNIVEIALDMWQSLDGKYGSDLNKTTELDQIVYYRPTYDNRPTLFTGIKRLPMEHGYNREGNIILWGDHNLPQTILGIGVKVGVDSD